MEADARRSSESLSPMDFPLHGTRFLGMMPHNCHEDILCCRSRNPGKSPTRIFSFGFIEIAHP